MLVALMLMKHTLTLALLFLFGCAGDAASTGAGATGTTARPEEVVSRYLTAPSASAAAEIVDWDLWQRHEVLRALAVTDSGKEAAHFVRSAAAALAHAPAAAREAFVAEAWRPRPECQVRAASEPERGKALPVLFPFDAEPGVLDFIIKLRRRLDAASAVSVLCDSEEVHVFQVNADLGHILAQVQIAPPIPEVIALGGGPAAEVVVAMDGPAEGSLVCFGDDCRSLPLELHAHTEQRLTFTLTAPHCLTSPVAHIVTGISPEVPAERGWLLLPILR